MRAIALATLAVALAGCATTPVPAMHPLTQPYVDQMGPTPVEVAQNNNGVEKSWFFTSTSSAGAAYGLLGVLITSVMDAIINAGPSARAQKAADEMSRLISVDDLNNSLAEHLRQQMRGAATATATPVAAAGAAATPVTASPATATPLDAGASATAPAAAPQAAAAPASGVSYESVEIAQRLLARTKPDDVVQISVRYTLSEDASTLRVQATATYQSPQTPYHSPYHVNGSPPRSDAQSPAYANTFTYYSTQLPVPTLTPELKDRLVASIENSAREANNGELPAEGSNEFRAMTREVENARDNNLTRDEIAIFLTREWLANDGAKLHQEIERAHDFIARYLLIDLNRTAVPSMTGQDELLETAADERTVRRIGEGVDAGSYVSSAANVTDFSSYGNTIAISHANAARIDGIRSVARASARAAAAH